MATCLEFPALSWLAETHSAAIDGLEALVAEVFEDMQAEGEEVPVPMSERRYSGIFNVRIGSLHRSLAMHAAEERVSLNQYGTKKLASGWCSASERCASSPGAAMPGDPLRRPTLRRRLPVRRSMLRDLMDMSIIASLNVV